MDFLVHQLCEHHLTGGEISLWRTGDEGRAAKPGRTEPGRGPDIPGRGPPVRLVAVADVA